MRRDLSEKVYYEIERARAEAHREYEDQLHTLENELADTHVKQLQTLQDVREKNKETVDNLKLKHQEELENAEKSFEEKLLLLKDALQNVAQAGGDGQEVNMEEHLRKLREDLNEAHSKVLDECFSFFLSSFLLVQSHSHGTVLILSLINCHEIL